MTSASDASPPGGVEEDGARPEQDADPVEQPGAVVDLYVLESLTSRLGDRGPAMLERLLETWEGETARHLVELDDALAADDAVALGRVAHAIRGGSASMGAVGLAGVCERLETAVRAGEQVDLPQARSQVLQAVEQARRALGQLRVGSAG